VRSGDCGVIPHSIPLVFSMRYWHASVFPFAHSQCFPHPMFSYLCTAVSPDPQKFAVRSQDLVGKPVTLRHFLVNRSIVCMHIYVQFCQLTQRSFFFCFSSLIFGNTVCDTQAFPGEHVHCLHAHCMFPQNCLASCHWPLLPSVTVCFGVFWHNPVCFLQYIVLHVQSFTRLSAEKSQNVFADHVKCSV
jgi:hypothetical protein